MVYILTIKYEANERNLRDIDLEKRNTHHYKRKTAFPGDIQLDSWTSMEY